MEKLTNIFFCPVIDKCKEINNGGCIFNRAKKLWKIPLPIMQLKYWKMQFKKLYNKNCKVLIKARSDRKIIANEVFR